ncbi:diguanylate cyclase [Neptunicoccus cionae]|uniref:diguanylate cyclase n=1 Tax=Neptunicoccus cionae TaxID=2035344 RepID=A0A916QS50_9RHOB|nr:diguanylate cyclase [Amylibacter cionae]GGA08704.1 PleD family two-component system response regulator [Amylibacter cionae]
MPGRILLLDPQVTNRMMMKSQLTRDFFDVALASDGTELAQSLRFAPPDLVILSYAAERIAGFANINRLTQSQDTAHIPVIFLHDSADTTVWDAAHDCLADDVMAYTTQRWLMAARINMLIRGKEKLDALMARQSTITQMGFAEPSVFYPPPFSKAVALDFSCALSIFNTTFQESVATLLSRDFPLLKMFRTPQDSAERPPADISLVDEASLGRTAAFQTICDLRKRNPDRETPILYACDTSSPNAARSLELGAQEFISASASPSRFATTLRRMIWQKQMSYRTERAVANHLKSALTDPLTGLYNRRYGLQYLDQQLARPQTSVTAMILDLDRFKSVNDSYGHLTGDRVLKEAAKRLLRNIRGADLLCRYGGEEFLVILRDTPLETLQEIADRLRRAICHSPFLDESGNRITVSASIGVSTSAGFGGGEAMEVLEFADRALYRAKDSGRNRVIFGDQAA